MYRRSEGNVSGRIHDGRWWSRDASSDSYARYLHTGVEVDLYGNVWIPGSYQRAYSGTIRYVQTRTP